MYSIYSRLRLFSNATEMMRDDWKEDGYLRLFAKQPPLTALRCLKLTETDIDVEYVNYNALCSPTDSCYIPI